MNTIRLSATSARNKFFELLNQVALGTRVIIEKDNKEIAILSPKTTKSDWKGLLKASRNLDVPDYIIAATALAVNAKVVTLNKKHFEQIPNLSLFSV